jgi:rare lipoprotein A
MRSSVNRALPLVVVAGLICTSVFAEDGRRTAQQASGPAADYPVIVGPAFQIDGTTHTPEDRLNYDAVGSALIGAEGGQKIAAAHKTLPLPSYAEVTALESGRTILVRVERRGPMVNDRLIELSPGAAAQLGLAADAPVAVHVRPANPPKQESATLGAGGRAPERMETPRGLLDALNRKLAATAPHAAPVTPTKVGEAPPVAKSSAAPSAASPPPEPRATPPSVTEPKRPASKDGLIVQVAALSTQARADGLAGKLGGHVSPAGRFWRVRLGPFAARGEAEAALAKAKSAGYSDARIQRAD